MILANPPFMSPKGGIKPHKRFSVQATRSEVLFVDYMAEHLSPQGRAAIIVPEGIIFQSGTAYKKLREMLVKNSLIAVVSLPAGVFNPYSGVKTSILILDKRRAKTCDSVLFVKVDNDGFGLGAQRRAVSGSGLPEAKRLLDTFFAAPEAFENDPSAHKVTRARIGEYGEWSLSGERYSIQEIRHSAHEIIALGEVCDVIAGQSPDGEYYNESGEGLPFYQGKTEFGNRWIGAPRKWTTQVTKIALSNDILMSVRAPVGPVNLCAQESCIGRGLASIRPKNSETVLFFYIFHVLRSMEESIIGNSGAVFASINKREIEELQIPLPPLAIQQEIVAEIEGYQKIIDGARQVVENYRPSIDVQPDWPIMELGNAADVTSGFSFDSKDFSETNPIKTIKIANVGVREFVTDDASNLPEYLLSRHSAYVVHCDDLVIALTRSIISTGLKIAVVPPEYHCSLLNQRVASIRGKANLSDSRFIYASLCSDFVYCYIEEKARSLMQPNLSIVDLKKLPISLPPLKTQRAIVAEIEAEQALVDANKQLITRFEEKIKAIIDRVWGGGEVA